MDAGAAEVRRRVVGPAGPNEIFKPPAHLRPVLHRWDSDPERGS